MKRFIWILTVAILSMMIASPIPAASTRPLVWDPPTTFTDNSPLNPAVDINHYNVKWGTVSGVYPNVVNVGKVNTYVITNVAPGTTIYAVVTAVTSTTATHAGGIESANSNMATYPVPLDGTPTGACPNARFLP